jgi:hypothetical protein
MEERVRCREIAELAARMGAPREVLLLAISGGDDLAEAATRYRRHAERYGVDLGPSSPVRYDGRRETYDASPELQAEFRAWGGFESFRSYSEALARRRAT